MHHQYSSSVSPFQAKTGMPASAIAAAAWSWVEKMLQEHQRTSAPSATSVSISTAVWIVMCSEPVMRAPLSGCAAANSSRVLHQAGHLVLGQLDLLAAERRRARGRRPCSRSRCRVWSSCLLGRGIRVATRRAGARACPARSSASRRGRRPPGARAWRRASRRWPGAAPPRAAGAARRRRPRGRCRAPRAARAGCAGAGARPARRGGSRTRERAGSTSPTRST